MSIDELKARIAAVEEKLTKADSEKEEKTLADRLKTLEDKLTAEEAEEEDESEEEEVEEEEPKTTKRVPAKKAGGKSTSFPAPRKTVVKKAAPVQEKTKKSFGSSLWFGKDEDSA